MLDEQGLSAQADGAALLAAPAVGFGENGSTAFPLEVSAAPWSMKPYTWQYALRRVAPTTGWRPPAATGAGH